MIKIQRGTIKDLDSIFELNLALFKFERKFGKTYSLKWTYSKVGKDYFMKRVKREDGIVFLAFNNEETIGYICGSINDSPERTMKKMSEVENMYVKGECRGRGVGSMLFKKFEDEARKKGVRRIKVSAIFYNDLAVKFYKKNGCQEHELVLEKDI